MRWGTRSSPAPSWLPLHTTSSMSTSSFTRPWWPSPNPTSTFLFVCSQQQLFVCLFGVLVSHSYNTHAHANSCSLTGTFSTHTHTVSLSLSTSQPLSQPLNLSHTILPPPHTHTHTHARTHILAGRVLVCCFAGTNHLHFPAQAVLWGASTSRNFGERISPISLLCQLCLCPPKSLSCSPMPPYFPDLGCCCFFFFVEHS